MSRRKRLPNFLREGEIDAVVAAGQAEIERATSERGRQRAVRDRMFAAVGLWMGLRVSEISKLRIEHVDLGQRSALISQAKGDKDRYVPVPVKLVELLRGWIGERTSGPVFVGARGGRVSVRTIQLRINRLGRLAGVERRVKAHTLRHSYATALLRKGASIVEIQELLGHSSIVTTQVYLHCDSSRLTPAVDRL